MKREINISNAVNVPATLATVRRIADRAAKKGLSGGYKIYTEDRRNEGRVETVLVVEGEPARFDGWAFVAMVEVENGGLVVSGSPYYEGPAFDRETFVKNHCDHCGRSVARRKYVIVERDGVRKQVGTACVKDFLGEEFRVSYFTDVLDEIEESYGGGSNAFHIISALEFAAHVISAWGFVKSGEQGSTRKVVADLLRAGREAREIQQEIGDPTAADAAEAQAAYAWAREMPGHSDYALNVQTVFGQDNPAIAFADNKRLGLVVSVISAYRRSQAEAKVKAERPSVPAPVGRVEVEGVVMSVKWQENDFGGSLKMLVEADPGFRVWTTVPRDLSNILVTYESGWQEYREVTVGERVAFTATLAPSDDDPAFAFGKRPTKARVLAA